MKECEGDTVYVVHDADEPGQEGATFKTKTDGTKRSGWCPRLTAVAAEVRNIKLPFPVEKTHGQDLRDLLAGGSVYSDLLELAERAEVFTVTEEQQKEIDATVRESIDDPHRLARVNLERYKAEHDGRLVFWRDEWMKWKDGRYRKIEIGELKAKVCAAIREEFEICWREQSGTDRKSVMKVTRSLVSNVVGAMESMCSLPSSIPMPCWLPV